VITGSNTPERGHPCESAAPRTPHSKEDPVSSTLTRPREGAIIAGVCAGLAERFGMSPFVVRLLFLLSCLLPGPQFLIYLVLWVIMPKRPY
jgi:phage shock protein PspC (stress-responsive transcriptional regulator)